MKITVSTSIAFVLVASFFSNALPAMSQSEPDKLARLQHIVRYSDNPGSASDELQEIIKDNPRNSQAHFLLGIMLERTGYADLATQEFEKADQLDISGHGSAVKIFKFKWENFGPAAADKYREYFKAHYPGDPSLHLIEAANDRLLGDYQSAERHYVNALSLHSGVPGIASEFAEMRLRQKRYDEAIKLADQDLSLKQDHPAATFTKARALFGLGKYLQAVPLVQAAYETPGPDQREAAELLRLIYERQGMFKVALEPALLSMALLEGKTNPERVQAKKNVEVLTKYSSDDNVVSAVENLKKQLSNKDSQARLLFGIADIMDKHGKRRLAAQFYDEATQLEPTSGRAYFRMARIKQLQGDFQSAKALYQHALALSPYDLQLKSSYERMNARLQNKHRDLSWQIKEAVH